MQENKEGDLTNIQGSKDINGNETDTKDPPIDYDSNQQTVTGDKENVNGSAPPLTAPTAAETSPVSPPAAAKTATVKQRLNSLDAFRGLELVTQ